MAGRKKESGSIISDLWGRLKRSGYRITDQRKLIIEVFLKLGGHLSAEDLFNEISKTRRRGAKIGLATVYRTLNMLKSAGIVSERQFGDGRIRYEIVSEHHDHLICEGCGKIVEFYDEEIEKRQKDISERYGFELLRHRHELIGLCPDCKARRKKSAKS